MPRSVVVAGELYTPPEGDVYTPRGDSASFDFTNADLNVIGAWTDLDVSGVVPVGVTAAVVQMLIIHGAGGAIFFRLRAKGDPLTALAAHLQPAGEKWRTGIVPIPATRLLQYKLSWAAATRAIYIAGTFK